MSTRTAPVAAFACVVCVGMVWGGAAQAALITYAGSVEGSQVADWRTASTPKAMDIDGDNIYGTFAAVHWTVGSTNEQAHGSANPGWSYWGETTYGQYRNPGYALVDHLTNPVTDIEAGIAAVQYPGRFTFELTGVPATYAGQTVRMGVMADVLTQGEWAADYEKTFQLVQTVGGAGDSGVVALRGGTAGNGVPEMYFFDLAGVNPGDRFELITGTGSTQAGYAGPVAWDVGQAGPPVPEPATIVLVALGLLGVGSRVRRGRKA